MAFSTFPFASLRKHGSLFFRETSFIIFCLALLSLLPFHLCSVCPTERPLKFSYWQVGLASFFSLFFFSFLKQIFGYKSIVLTWLLFGRFKQGLFRVHNDENLVVFGRFRQGLFRVQNDEIWLCVV